MVSESSSLNINQLTSLVSKQLKVADEKFKSSTKEHFDWNNIRRTPQFLKQKAKLGSYTVDEEFDELHDNLLFIERRLQSLNKYSHVFVNNNLAILTICKNIGLLIKELFDPYNSLPKSIKEQLSNHFNKSPDGSIFSSKSTQLIFEEEYRLWEDAESYIECIKNIEPAIKSELELLANTVEIKIGEILKVIKSIKKNIKLRSYALMDYDKVFNNHENLIIKQKNNELTIKQSQQLYNLERKLEENKLSYDNINEILKKELPYFFKLIDLTLEPIQIMIYYVQLMVSYQVNTNLLSITEIFNIKLEDLKTYGFNENLIKLFNMKNKSASDLINELSIVNFRENFLKNLTSNEKLTDNDSNFIDNYDPKFKYCQAIFNYKGEVDGDISIKQGDIIKIIKKNGNWWKGELDGEVGLFPSNYVKEIN